MTANRVWIYGGIILMLLVFLAVMTSGVVLKKPITGQDDVIGQVNKIKSDITNGRWDKATTDTAKLDKAWKSVRTRVLFSSEKDDIKKVDEHVETLKADVETRDKSSAFRQLNLLKDGYKDIE